MSDLKYYTPSIEEVHHGFEYEFHYVVEGWKKETFGNIDFDYLENNIKEQLIRVKHLDKDDIESLGFYEMKLKDSNNVVYLKDVNQGFNTGYTVALSINHNSFVTINYKSFSSYMNKEYSIDMIIKNKSELARLLKQLNIQ